MRAARSQIRSQDRFRRFIAGGCALLVLALSVLAASPVAHDRLHAAAPGAAEHEDGCAVVLFSGGVSLPVGPIALAPPQLIQRGAAVAAVAELLLVAPRYLRQPERGPPV